MTTITPEIAERLRRNLIFNKEDEAGTPAVGALTILVRDETRESIEELFGILSLLVKSNRIIGMDLEDSVSKLSNR